MSIWSQYECILWLCAPMQLSNMPLICVIIIWVQYHVKHQESTRIGVFVWKWDRKWLNWKVNARLSSSSTLALPSGNNEMKYRFMFLTFVKTCVWLQTLAPPPLAFSLSLYHSHFCFTQTYLMLVLIIRYMLRIIISYIDGQYFLSQSGLNEWMNANVP